MPATSITSRALAALWTAADAHPGEPDVPRAAAGRARSRSTTRVEICHGAPFDEDHYVFDVADAGRALDTASRPVCLFGHTHLPVVYRRDAEGDAGVHSAKRERHASMCRSTSGARYLVNPGSVGQPRDGDPRAAFAIYDGERG